MDLIKSQLDYIWSELLDIRSELEDIRSKFLFFGRNYNRSELDYFWTLEEIPYKVIPANSIRLNHIWSEFNDIGYELDEIRSELDEIRSELDHIW